jgi:glycerol-3-phosphate O-acyltransferase
MKRFSSAKTVPEFLRDARFRHLEWVLDEEPGWVLRKLISRLSTNVHLDSEDVDRIKELGRRGPIVYALKYRSVYDLHFLRMRCAELGLPPPGFVFGLPAGSVGSVGKILQVYRAKLASMVHPRTVSGSPDKRVLKEILENRAAGVMFLSDEEIFRNRYVNPDRDPLRVLLDIQGSLAGSICVVPIFILYDRRPRRAIRPFWESFLGDPDRPGPIKRLLIAARKWTVPEVLVGDPAHLVGEFEEFGSDKSWEDLPFELRSELLSKINARIRASRGPEKLTRTEIKERVLRDDDVQAAVTRIASENRTSVQKVRKKAEAHVEEIAADQQIHVIHFFYHLLQWIFSHIFDGIDVREEQFSSLKRTNEKGSLIFVPCHKSHFDYLVMPYFTFTRQMPIPLIAAGKNLSFWPLGPLLRRAAAFFIRRSFKGLDLYTKVFGAYLKVLVREGFNISFYMEGGRSRTGKLLAPRLGMLNFLLKTVREGAVDDLIFIPTFMAYEQIPEEKSYLRELSGFDKKKESIGSIIRARKILQKRYGKVYLRFDEPVSHHDFHEKWKERFGSTGEASPENGDFARDFAYHLMAGIVHAGVVTPVDLAAAALVCAGGRDVRRSTFMEAARCLSLVIEKRGIETAESLENREEALAATLGLFTRRGFIRAAQADEPNGETTYTILEQSRVNLDFYRNALVNHLWSASLIGFMVLDEGNAAPRTKESLGRGLARFRRLLAGELIVDPLKTDDAVLDEVLPLFLENGWVAESGDGEFRPEDPVALGFFNGVLEDLLESYYLVLAATEEAAEGISLKEFTKLPSKNTAAEGAEREPEQSRRVASVTVRSALTRLHELGVVDYDQSKKIFKSVIDPAARDRWKELLGRATGRAS